MTEAASISIARITTDTLVEDVIAIDIKLPGQKLKLRMPLEEYALLITGISEVPAVIAYNRVMPEIPQPQPSRRNL